MMITGTHFTGNVYVESTIEFHVTSDRYATQTIRVVDNEHPHNVHIITAIVSKEDARTALYRAHRQYMEKYGE